MILYLESNQFGLKLSREEDKCRQFSPSVSPSKTHTKESVARPNTVSYLVVITEQTTLKSFGHSLRTFIVTLHFDLCTRMFLLWI